VDAARDRLAVVARWARTLAPALAAAIAVVLGWRWLARHSAVYFPFFADDSFISLRYSQRLLAGHGLGWNDGEPPVEGYSNFLWVIGCAVTGLFKRDLVAAARGLGTASSVVAIAAVCFTWRPRQVWDFVPALIGARAMALSGTVAVWAIGGLEQPLLIALLGLGLVCLLRLDDEPDPAAPSPRRARWLRIGAAVAFGLLGLTRPDAPLLWAAALGAWALARGLDRPRWKSALVIGLVAAGFTAAQLVFRRLYYHDWVPNTAYAKLAFSHARFREGARYVLDAFATHRGLTVLALLGLPFALWDRRRRPGALAMLAALLAWSIYVARIGGDIFPARRHFAPQVLLLAMLAVLGLGAWLERMMALRPSYLRVLALALPLGASWQLERFARAQRTDKPNVKATRERWEWKTPPIGALLKRHFKPKDALLAADALGAMAYFSELRVLDMLGLNDRWLARHPPKDLGQGFIGHELGDGKYFLERNPDLVIFLPPGGVEQAHFRGGIEMQADPRFHQRYVKVSFRAGKMTSLLWVNWQSPRVGVAGSGTRTVVPGYLLGGGVAVEDGDGRLGVEARAPHRVRFDHVPVRAGRVRVTSAHSGGAATVRAGVGSAVLGEGLGEAVLDIPAGAAELWLEVIPSGTAPIHVREVTLDPA